MREVILRTSLNINNNLKLKMLLMIKDVEAIKKEILMILDSKKQIFSRFAVEHDLENIGVETEICPNGLFCNFVAINRFKEINLSDRDRADFAELLGTEFVLLDNDLTKPIGFLKNIDCSKDSLEKFYNFNSEIFYSLSSIYNEKDLKFDYIEKIEKFLF